MPAETVEPDGDALPELPPIEITCEDGAQCDREWLAVITTMLASRTPERDPSGRVQFALDQLHIAACERAVRILHGDMQAADPECR